MFSGSLSVLTDGTRYFCENVYFAGAQAAKTSDILRKNQTEYDQKKCLPLLKLPAILSAAFVVRLLIHALVVRRVNIIDINQRHF
jgi:hypothetical protein